MSNATKIGIVGGAGWLGRAIAGSLVRAGAVSETDLILSFRSRRPDVHPTAFWTCSNQELVDRSNVVIISVRPDDWRALSIDVRGMLVISVMAGISIDELCRRHNTGRIVRALPNAATEIGLSYTPWIASAQITELDRIIAGTIFDACGIQDEVANESHIDYLTGLTGSGPAYPALLALAMLEDARSRGLSEDIAVRAVNSVIIGAGGLLKVRPERPEKTLETFLEYRGTTAAGLNAMKDRGFLTAVSGGLGAALERTLVMGGRPLKFGTDLPSTQE